MGRPGRKRLLALDAAWLRSECPDQTTWHVCHETIYQGLYFGGPNGLARTLARHLRTGRGLRFPRRPAKGRRPRFTVAAKLIDERPAVVEDRSRIGDFEGDLIIGCRGESAIATLVDRKTRLVGLVRLDDNRRNKSVTAAIRAAMSSLPVHARRTLTWDQGPEMARHDLLADVFTDGVFFAYPGAPWQRGSNENTNGLLRQYLSRKTDLATITAAELTRIENLLNNRPRKTLGWRTPADLFTAAMAH